MDISYIAFDSHGVKAMCVQVKTKDVAITIDPGISIETNSFPLSMEERLGLESHYKGKIQESCSVSDVVVITHYHYDHHLCEKDPKLYGGKRLLIKDPNKNINFSQKGRSKKFLETVEGLTHEVTVADENSFNFGNTQIDFTPAIPHGAEGTKLGFVIGLRVTHKRDSLFFSSDLNGVLEKDQVSMILKNDSKTLILDGPPTYLLGYVFSYRNLLRSIENLTKIVEKTKAKLIVLDHHLLRDYRYRELLHPVYERAEEVGVDIKTAAEAQGRKPKVMEAYEKNGPTKWKTWERTSINGLREKVREIGRK